MFYIVPLGNPNKEYKKTRHNTGRIFIEWLMKRHDFHDFSVDTKSHSNRAMGIVHGNKIEIIEPLFYMNESGKSLREIIKKKDLKKLILIHDDMDIPLGKVKVSYEKESAGHRGVDSVIKELGGRKFFRIRIGVTKRVGKKNVVKPKNSSAVKKFVLGEFKKEELLLLKKTFPVIEERITDIILGRIVSPR